MVFFSYEIIDAIHTSFPLTIIYWSLLCATQPCLVPGQERGLPSSLSSLEVPALDLFLKIKFNVGITYIR